MWCFVFTANLEIDLFLLVVCYVIVNFIKEFIVLAYLEVSQNLLVNFIEAVYFIAYLCIVICVTLW